MPSKKVKLKKWYIQFIEKEKYSFFEKMIYGAFYSMSLIFSFLVKARNFFYDKNILKPYRSTSSFLLGVGNISWAGTGKTPLALKLYHRFSFQFKTAILRRGYGKDEEKLIKKECQPVFSSLNRKNLVERMEKSYQLFVFDDGFQYRKLEKDCEIVIMGAREFKRKIRLIPAFYFREPLKSLNRADFVIINYKDNADREKIKKNISKLSSPPELYFAGYQPENLKDLRGNIYPLEFLKNKKVAAFAAIGYPRGFFQLLEGLGVNLAKKNTYPDHYSLSKKEYFLMEEDLISSGIKTLVITEKDKYHLPRVKKEVDIFILTVKLEIEREDELVAKITEKIKTKLAGTKN